ncbi:MAG TPA: hypothetical protein VFS20_04340 [Longimicrobium sp.]|nr:hypothetical protein [Longimicrobium sp.]
MSGRLGGRDGFALLAALWILVGVSALVLAVALAGRDASHAARNRVALARARWRAADCLERARAVLAATAAPSASRAAGTPGWSQADRAIHASPLVPDGCDLRVRAAGTRVDVNAADVATLSRLFRAAGVPAFRADSLADALADWRDDDDLPRPLGAERPWYGARETFLPRNGPLADVRELARVRGLGSVPGLDTLAGVEPGRVAINHAPPAVLASLPGVGAEAVARLLEMRARGEAVADLAAFTGSLSPGARQELERAYAELAPRVALAPDAWIVTSRAAEGQPEVAAVVEVTLVNAGTRVAVIKRKTWSE